MESMKRYLPNVNELDILSKYEFFKPGKYHKFEMDCNGCGGCSGCGGGD